MRFVQVLNVKPVLGGIRLILEVILVPKFNVYLHFILMDTTVFALRVHMQQQLPVFPANKRIVSNVAKMNASHVKMAFI